MPVYDRSDPDRLRIVDRWDVENSAGFGWFAHPDEFGRRTSHAVRGPDGVWLFDPLDAPGIDEHLADLGDVAGVAVLSDYHARDAAAFARRNDVPVTVPSWLSRVTERVDAPVEVVDGAVAGFELRRLKPLRAWRECLAYREADGTLYVPDFLSTHPKFTVGDERLGLPTGSRLFPPREQFADVDPERIILGHGEGLFDGPAEALADTIANARKRFPRALVSNPRAELRAMLGAL